jgi:hypothetical protein
MITTNTSSNEDAFLPLASREFAIYTTDDLIGFTTNGITHVTGYAPVAAIKPTIAEMQAGLDDLIAKNAAARNGGRTERMLRNLAKKATVDQIRQWAGFIESVADGDRMVIVNCGFQLRRASTPSTIPATPTNVRVADGKVSGEAVLRCKGGRNVRNFSSQYAESADGPWIDRPLTTKARGTVVPGLTPGKVYWYRMRANGAAGSSDGSMPACKRAV